MPKVKIMEAIKRLSTALPRIESVSLKPSDFESMHNAGKELHDAAKELHLKPLAELATEITDLVHFLQHSDASQQGQALKNLKSKLHQLPEQLKSVAALSQGDKPQPTKAGDMKQEEYEAKLEALKASYTERLPGRLTEVRGLWGKLLDSNWDTTVLGDLYQHIHQLRGNAASFGFPALGEASIKLDDLLNELRKDEVKPTYNQSQEIEKEFAIFLDYADGVVNGPSDDAESASDESAGEDAMRISEEDTSAKKKQIYLVDDDIHLAQYLALQIEHFGFEVKLFSSTKNVLEAIEEHPPAIILMDIMFPEGDLAGTDIIQKIREQNDQEIPVIFFSARQDLTARLEAVRAKGDAYFTKPVNMDSLLNKIWELTTTDGHGDLNIVILQKTPQKSKTTEEALSKIGFHATVIETPAELFERIDELQPELLILGLDIGELSGIDVAQMLRQEVEFSSLPILFIAESQSPDPKLLSLSHEMGVDLLNEPIDRTHLMATLNRVIHAKESTSKKLDEANKRDPLTGFHNRYYFLHLLSLTHAEVEAGEEEYSILYLSLDNTDLARQNIGLAASNRVTKELSVIIRSHAALKDMIGRVGDCNFVIVEPSIDNDALINKAEALRKAIEGHVVFIDGKPVMSTCTIGIANIKQEVAAEEILKQTQNTVNETQQSGGNRISVIEVSERLADREDLADVAAVTSLIDKAISEKRFSRKYQAIPGLHGKPEAYYELLLVSEPPLQLDGDEQPLALQKLLKYPAYIKIDKMLIDEAIKALAEPSVVESTDNLFIRISEAAIIDDSFGDWLVAALSPEAVKSDRMIFQIPAFTLLQYPDQGRHICELLEKMECTVAVCDFDCSPEAFQALNLVNYEFVKISENLIVELHDGNREAKTNLAHLIGHAQKLDKRVIAPGVQYASILNILWKLGTNYVQGDFIHAAADTTDFEFLRVI